MFILLLVALTRSIGPWWLVPPLLSFIWGAESCCLQREVEGSDGKAGLYTLVGPDYRCGDGCLYQKEGDSRNFCFQDGDYDIICNSTQAPIQWTTKAHCLAIMGGWHKDNQHVSDHFTIMTGIDDSTEFESCQLLDGDDWKGSLPAKRHNMIAALSDTSKDIIICGGTDDKNDARKECWTSKNYPSSWTKLSDMPEKNSGAGYASVGDTLYVFGGVKDSNNFHKSIQKYNMETDTWTTSATPMTGERAYHCAVAFEHYIILTGGDNNGTKGEGESITTVEVFNTLNEQWETTMASLTYSRKMHGCGLVKMDGQVGILVAGGGQWPSTSNVLGGEGKSATTEFLSLEGDFTQNKWVVKPDMTVKRAGRPAVGYIGNEIAIFGGHNTGAGDAVDSIEVWRNSKWINPGGITESNGNGDLDFLFWRTVISVPCSIPLIGDNKCYDLYEDWSG